jgi:hypothetical protein
VNRREAKRAVCSAAAALLEAGDNYWLWEDLTPAAAAQMRQAFRELITELRRRSGRP